jgi:hypothetical protein
MLWLIKANLASAGKPNVRDRTPAFFVNLGELNALLGKRCHLGFEGIAHEIEFMRTILGGWVECGFSRWEGENQPTMARIHGLEPENVAEKCPIRFGIFSVDNYVNARNHMPLQKMPGTQSCRHVPLNLQNSMKIKFGHYQTAGLVSRGLFH